MNVCNFFINHNVFVFRNIAILIREPELGYNKENSRVPRQGQAYLLYYGGRDQVLQRRKREDEEELFKHDKQHWIDLFEGFNTDMEDTYSDLALFLFCMLN